MAAETVASLADPLDRSVAAASIEWISNTMMGSVATIIAVLAVASIGFVMMTGRIDLRRGLSVSLGCFVLFGASAIAAGLTRLVDRSGYPEIAQSAKRPVLAPEVPLPPAKQEPYDPYAGAAVPQ